jgi:hypothetical protein
MAPASSPPDDDPLTPTAPIVSPPNLNWHAAAQRDHVFKFSLRGQF